MYVWVALGHAPGGRHTSDIIIRGHMCQVAWATELAAGLYDTVILFMSEKITCCTYTRKRSALWSTRTYLPLSHLRSARKKYLSSEANVRNFDLDLLAQGHAAAGRHPLDVSGDLTDTIG